jgi:hypothetical protein
MSEIKNITELNYAIRSLEDKLALNRKLLGEQFVETYETFRPVNLITNTLKRFISPSFLIEKFLGPALGLAAGYLFRK